RALEITELLVPRPVSAINVSAAFLIRIVAAEEGLPTILFDEADATFGSKAKDSNEDVRALLNAGYRRGATVGRCAVYGATVVPEMLPAFAPVALAGLIRDSLCKLPESPWNEINKGKPLTDRGLAVRLRGYGIKPKLVRIGSTVARGYRQEDFTEAWRR